jgi:hypothetical protein
MDKKLIVKFLKAKKRGVYTVIVECYSEVIQSMNATMSLDVIKEDLERESGESVELKYFSLVQAIAKFKNKNPTTATSTNKKKWEFKDSSELSSSQETPGKFKLD